MNDDILKIILDEDLPTLRDIYSEHLPSATYVYSLLNTCIKWKNQKPDKNYVTFMSADDDWKTNGTFILLMHYGCYDIFIFTLEKECDTLYKALTETKLIKWDNVMYIYAVMENHVPTTIKALSILEIPITSYIDCYMWWIPKERALKFTIECPDEIYISKLNVSHAALVNKLWPHRYTGTENYIAAFIEMNEGHGIYLKQNNKLVAWVLKNNMGVLGILQTLEEHKRKGYAALITKSLAKEIAEDGHNPAGTIVKGNVASENLFRNLGFEILHTSVFFKLH